MDLEVSNDLIEKSRKQLFGEIPLWKLETLGWWRDSWMSKTMQKGDFLLNCWQLQGIGEMDIELKIKDNVNGVYLMRGIEDKYKTIYKGNTLTEQQLEELFNNNLTK